jgi:hypothetical protein
MIFFHEFFAEAINYCSIAYVYIYLYLVEVKQYFTKRLSNSRKASNATRSFLKYNYILITDCTRNFWYRLPRHFVPRNDLAINILCRTIYCTF